MKSRRVKRIFDDQFRLSVLKEYYESGVSIESICRKYGINNSNFHYWEKKYEDKLLSLPSEVSELCQQVFMLKKEREKYQHTPIPASQSSETDRLHAEISRLRKALEYSELRNEALNEVLRIGREKYGVDLLKKSWRQAVDTLRLKHPGVSIGMMSGLFGKSREGYYSVSRERCTCCSAPRVCSERA